MHFVNIRPHALGYSCILLGKEVGQLNYQVNFRILLAVAQTMQLLALAYSFNATALLLALLAT